MIKADVTCRGQIQFNLSIRPVIGLQSPQTIFSKREACKAMSTAHCKYILAGPAVKLSLPQSVHVFAYIKITLTSQVKDLLSAEAEICKRSTISNY